MNDTISPSLWSILACPYCGDALRNFEQGASCDRCQSEYLYSGAGALDLRLQRRKTVQCEFELGTHLRPTPGFRFDVLPVNDAPEVDYAELDLPEHLSRELLSHFPKAHSAESWMLDLGCGIGICRNVCEYAGFNYVGLDYSCESAPLLGDAHSLPFKNESFEFILSVAVLEHIRFPFVMVKEACRVLKPGGIFIGTVAFLEPFHQDSFYHHTHLGTYNTLQQGGFEIVHVCPSDQWSVLAAQATMGLFPRMPRFLGLSLVMPLQVMHKLWWKVGGAFLKKDLERSRLLNTTGAFTFIARK